MSRKYELLVAKSTTAPNKRVLFLRASQQKSQCIFTPTHKPYLRKYLNMPKTYTISAQFAKNNAVTKKSDLEKSLDALNFSNYIFFDHRNITSPSLKLDKFAITNINPMNSFSKLFREALRRNIFWGGSKTVQRLFQKQYFLMIPHNLRHFYYKHILEKLDPNDFVFLVDSRDLIFQINPQLLSIELEAIADLHFFDERSYNFKSKKLQIHANSDTNMRWLRLLKDDSSYNFSSIGETFIVNGSCIAGKVKAVQAFNEIVCSKIISNRYRFHEILDQAVVNLPIYDNELVSLDFKVHHNGDYILNMCGVIESQARLEEGKLYVGDRQVPIIHQYDRFGSYSDKNGIKTREGKYQYQNL